MMPGSDSMMLYSDRKWKILTNDSSRTLSGHFFAICIFIFHKTEVQMVILRCWMGLNLDWFRNYGLRCGLKLRTSSANSQKIATAKWPCNDHAWPFFANYMFIFHKTEVQTHILSCWTSLNLKWTKGYDTKHKMQKAQMGNFVQNCKKTNMQIFAFCVITLKPIRI